MIDSLRETAITSVIIPEIVEKAMPSAVGISSTFTYKGQTSNYAGFGFGGMYGGAQPADQTVSAAGSGIVMSSDGYIVTNAHVIYDTESEYQMGKATSVSVIMGENHDEEYEAEIVGYVIQTDLAVLKIDTEGLTPAFRPFHGLAFTYYEKVINPLSAHTVLSCIRS